MAAHFKHPRLARLVGFSQELNKPACLVYAHRYSGASTGGMPRRRLAFLRFFLRRASELGGTRAAFYLLVDSRTFYLLLQ